MRCELGNLKHETIAFYHAYPALAMKFALVGCINPLELNALFLLLISFCESQCLALLPFELPGP